MMVELETQIEELENELDKTLITLAEALEIIRPFVEHIEEVEKRSPVARYSLSGTTKMNVAPFRKARIFYNQQTQEQEF